jgi:hypothetical protein
MDSLLGSLNQLIGGATIRQISGQVGADESATSSVAQMALPLLVGALARNSADPAGAGSLFAALTRDHDGSILDDVAGFLANAQASQGDGILGHIFSDRRAVVESELSRSSGLDAGQVSQILAMLAPIVMGLLGRTQRQQGLDPNGLAGLLASESQQALPAASPLWGMLSQALDSDRDGQIIDDIASLGAGLFSNAMKNRNG